MHSLTHAIPTPLPTTGQPSMLEEIQARHISPTVLLMVLCAAALPTALALLMMAPLLVELAQVFQTSVAVTGQLAAATAITWGIVAPWPGRWPMSMGAAACC